MRVRCDATVAVKDAVTSRVLYFGGDLCATAPNYLKSRKLRAVLACSSFTQSPDGRVHDLVRVSLILQQGMWVSCERCVLSWVRFLRGNFVGPWVRSRGWWCAQRCRAPGCCDRRSRIDHQGLGIRFFVGAPTRQCGRGLMRAATAIRLVAAFCVLSLRCLGLRRL